ncbi:MAG: asnB [Bacteroidetes bacterium]|nr:asnB [Bacteroidota bacterium]
MCGIAGFYTNNVEENAPVILRRMLTRIKYRGPDESGIYISKNACLGSVRLSIIDLKTGCMPLSNEDKSLLIVYNGEIFNYIELKGELLKKGHHFNTHSDTEVILHLYEEYGPECLKKLNGQFAIAIWDTRKKELFLARDRMGIRPLFYTEENGSFIFSSEIKSLLEYPEVTATLSVKALSQVFTFWTTISPETIFKDIFEVSPGHYLLVNSKGIQNYQYWEIPLYRQDEYLQIGIDEAISEFRTLFSDAVNIRLRADVPVAAYLSGGLDSCITTSFIKEVVPDNLQTYSIGFTDKEYDESIYQDMANEYLKTNHNRIICSNNDIAEKIADLIWHSETVLLRSAPAPMYLLSGLVKSQNIKVVVTGEGADELLGGYNIFKEAIIRQFWSREPSSELRPLLLKKLYPYLPQIKSANSAALKLFFGYKLEENKSPVYSHLLRWNNTSHIKNYFSSETTKEISGYDPVNELIDNIGHKFDDIDLLSRAQWLEMTLFMSGYLLSSQGDRMSMANSVEGRYPFLDYRIVDFCMKLPSDYKLHGLNEKYLLKKMMAGKLPPQILEKPKQAYRAPISTCFTSESAPDFINEMLSEKQLISVGIFNPDKVQYLITRLKKNNQVSETDNMALMGILSTQLLDYLFVKRNIPMLKETELLKCNVEIYDDY